MSSAPKKAASFWLLITLTILTFCSWFLVIKPVFADPLTPTPSIYEPVSKANWSPEAQAIYTTENAIVCGGLAMLTGGCPYTSKVPTHISLGNGEVKLGMVKQVPNGGAMGALSNLTVAMYSPPTSTLNYLADLGENIGLSPKSANAQVVGSGEGIIKPVLKLWQVSRNIAYLAFIAVFIVIGFMIMFRQKINPQTVISVQAALPGLIIGLILVTFSYFIAALLVDTSFLGIKLVGEVFVQAAPNSFGSTEKIRSLAEDSNILQMFWSASGVVNNSRDSLTNGMTDLLKNVGTVGGISFLTALIPAVVGGILGFLIGGPLGIVLGGAGGLGVGIVKDNTLPYIASGLISLILVIAFFIQMFRVFLALLGAYIQILVATITGPFMILFSSIPGNGGSLSGWIKSILANALIFPAIFAAFLFAGVILGNTTADDWKVSPPLFGGVNAELLRVLLAYGIILGIPAIPDMIKNAFKVKGPEGFDKAALGGFMGGLGVGRGAVGKGYGRAFGDYARTQEAYHKQKAEGRAGNLDKNVPPDFLGRVIRRSQIKGWLPKSS